jgi:hypothetical protein
VPVGDGRIPHLFEASIQLSLPSSSHHTHHPSSSIIMLAPPSPRRVCWVLSLVIVVSLVIACVVLAVVVNQPPSSASASASASASVSSPPPVISSSAADVIVYQVGGNPYSSTRRLDVGYTVLANTTYCLSADVQPVDQLLYVVTGFGSYGGLVDSTGSFGVSFHTPSSGFIVVSFLAGSDYLSVSNISLSLGSCSMSHVTPVATCSVPVSPFLSLQGVEVPVNNQVQRECYDGQYVRAVGVVLGYPLLGGVTYRFSIPSYGYDPYIAVRLQFNGNGYDNFSPLGTTSSFGFTPRSGTTVDLSFTVPGSGLVVVLASFCFIESPGASYDDISLLPVLNCTPPHVFLGAAYLLLVDSS